MPQSDIRSMAAPAAMALELQGEISQRVVAMQGGPLHRVGLAPATLVIGGTLAVAFGAISRDVAMPGAIEGDLVLVTIASTSTKVGLAAATLQAGGPDGVGIFPGRCHVAGTVRLTLIVASILAGTVHTMTLAAHAYR